MTEGAKTPMTVTKDQMKAIEKQANDRGLPYLQMMENAGTAAFRLLTQRLPGLRTAAVFCGSGNNGGDGFVLARLLREMGAEVLLILAGEQPHTPDAVTNFYRALMLDIPLVTAALLTEEDLAFILQADAVVDAVYGTGFHGDLPLEAGICAGVMAKAKGLRLALDLPSGLECDTGIAAPDTPRADLTAAFHACKPCHTLAPDLCGEVVVLDIGLRL